MGSIWRTRSVHSCAGQVPRGQSEPLVASDGCPGPNRSPAAIRGVSIHTQAFFRTRGRAGRYAATALGALALAFGAFAPAAAQAAAPATLFVSQSGLDSATCTEACPCAHFSYALTQVPSRALIADSG